MIIDKIVKVKIGFNSITWYKNKGYNVSIGKIIDVLIEDLTDFSSSIVNVKCFVCEQIKHKKY